MSVGHVEEYADRGVFFCCGSQREGRVLVPRTGWGTRGLARLVFSTAAHDSQLLDRSQGERTEVLLASSQSGSQEVCLKPHSHQSWGASPPETKAQTWRHTALSFVAFLQEVEGKVGRDKRRGGICAPVSHRDRT